MKLYLKGIDNVPLDGKLVFIAMDLTKACNLNCLYCFEESGRANKNELSLEEKISILNQAKEMEARTLVIAGAGEPLMDPDFHEIINYANSLNLVSVVYTNGTLWNEKMARFMIKRNGVPIFKLDSLDSKVHDQLTRIKGSHRKSIEAIKTCLRIGYGVDRNSLTNIATATVYVKQNLSGIPRLVDWAQAKGIKATVDVLGVHGRAKKNEKILKPTMDEIIQVQQQIGGESVCQTGQPCKIWKHGLFIDSTGYAKYCSEIPTKELGNIRQFDLETLLTRKEKAFPARVGNFSCPLKEKGY